MVWPSRPHRQPRHPNKEPPPLPQPAAPSGRPPLCTGSRRLGVRTEGGAVLLGTIKVVEIARLDRTAGDLGNAGHEMLARDRPPGGPAPSCGKVHAQDRGQVGDGEALRDDPI